MKGTNKMLLNQATMLEAINHYFSTVLFASGRAPKASEVKSVRRHYGPDEFEVEVSTTEGGEATNGAKP